MRMVRASLSLVLLGVTAACVAEVDVDLAGGRDVPTWEDFLQTTFQEPQTGIYIVDGDVPVLNQKSLRAFYDRWVSEATSDAAAQPLVVHQAGGVDVRWSDAQKHGLSYCVSTQFGARYELVVQAMHEATTAWASVADIAFQHVAEADLGCGEQSPVLFHVAPVDVRGAYLARAFFPHQPRSARALLIDDSSFRVQLPLTLTGVLRHEVGHTLGFRHEHTRPEAGACFEDSSWRPLTAYDAASVMHYPHCNGVGNHGLTLSTADAQGAAALYGTPSGTPRPQPTGASRQDTVQGTLSQGEQAQLGAYTVVPGSTLEVEMSGEGDPDLYVRFAAAPTLTTFACRPYIEGANEHCSLTVPAGSETAHVMVAGYAASRYVVTVRYLAPDEDDPVSGATASDAAPQEARVQDQVAAQQSKTYGPYTVADESTFVAALSGTGDPDLYVRFGAPPNLQAYDCRPYQNGAAERCELTAPAGVAVAYVMVRGYTDADYELSLQFTGP